MTFAATLALLYAGGFTTTIGAGMVFPDWPLSNGSLNPPGWTTDQAMLAEHGHRLMGATVGLLCIGLVVFAHLAPSEAWLRRAAWLALALVIFQGLLGGLRVLFVNIDLAKVHGVVAQVFLCLLASIAAGSSLWWKQTPATPQPEEAGHWRLHRRLGTVLSLLIMLQLVIGAIMRHRGAGLAVPYFPHAAADGAWLPEFWGWAVQVHMLHRLGAVLIYAVLLFWLFRIFRQPMLPAVVRKLGIAAFVLVHLQILLGALVIWNLRQPIETTLHVLNGAIFLSVCWTMTFVFWKPKLVSETSSRASDTELSEADHELPAQALPETNQIRA